MTQPSHVPVLEEDEVRAVWRLPAPGRWTPDRVAEMRQPGQPRGHLLGEQGPDQGYALKLAEHFEHSLVLAEGESAHDAVAGCLGVALARASLYGRAPVSTDLELAFTLFGFLGEAPEDLVKVRQGWFSGCGHDYWAQLAVGERVPRTTLRMTPATVRASLEEWQHLLRV